MERSHCCCLRTCPFKRLSLWGCPQLSTPSLCQTSLKRGRYVHPCMSIVRYSCMSIDFLNRGCSDYVSYQLNVVCLRKLSATLLLGVSKSLNWPSRGLPQKQRPFLRYVQCTCVHLMSYIYNYMYISTVHDTFSNVSCCRTTSAQCEPAVWVWSTTVGCPWPLLSSANTLSSIRSHRTYRYTVLLQWCILLL